VIRKLSFFLILGSIILVGCAHSHNVEHFSVVSIQKASGNEFILKRPVQGHRRVEQVCATDETLDKMDSDLLPSMIEGLCGKGSVSYDISLLKTFWPTVLSEPKYQCETARPNCAEAK